MLPCRLAGAASAAPCCSVVLQVLRQPRLAATSAAPCCPVVLQVLRQPRLAALSPSWGCHAGAARVWASSVSRNVCGCCVPCIQCSNCRPPLSHAAGPDALVMPPVTLLARANWSRSGVQRVMIDIIQASNSHPLRVELLVLLEARTYPEMRAVQRMDCNLLAHYMNKRALVIQLLICCPEHLREWQRKQGKHLLH